MCVRACVCVCVRAHARACVRACVRVCEFIVLVEVLECAGRVAGDADAVEEQRAQVVVRQRIVRRRRLRQNISQVI